MQDGEFTTNFKEEMRADIMLDDHIRGDIHSALRHFGGYELRDAIVLELEEMSKELTAFGYKLHAEEVFKYLMEL